MKKNSIITLTSLLIILIVGTVYWYNTLAPAETIDARHINDSHHTFKDFPIGTIIKTNVLNNNKNGHSYDPLTIQSNLEELTRNNINHRSYDIFYTVSNNKVDTIDILLNVNKNNGKALIQVKNTKPKSLIKITDGTNIINKSTPTDWSGNLILSNAHANRTVCIVLNNYMDKTAQICHFMQKNKEATNA